MQQPMINPEDIFDPTTAMNMALVLIAKAFKLNYSTPTNNNHKISSNPRNRQIAQPGMMNPSVQNVRNQNRLIVVPWIANPNMNQHGNGNVVAAQAEGDLDDIKEVNANCILMANLQQASTSEQYTELLDPIPEPHQVQQNDSNVISVVSSVEKSGGTIEQHLDTTKETHALYDSLYNNLAIKVETVNSVNRNLKETNAELTTELARYKNQEKYFEINHEKYDKLERCYQKSVYQEQCLTKKIIALHLSSAKMITTLNEEIANLNNQLSKEKSTVSFLNEKKKLKSDFKIREEELLDKQIQLENKIKELDNILVKMGQSIQTMHMLSPKPDSFYHTEQKMALGYQNPFYLKQAQQKQQSLYNGKVLLEKHDPLIVYDFEEILQLAQESRLKMKQLNKEIKPANYAKINHLSNVFVSQKAKSREEFHDIMSIVQNSIVVETSDLQTELEPYKDMQQKIEWLQAQLGDQKGKSKDTLEPLSQKLEDENVELEFQVSGQKDITKGTSVNTQFRKQSILRKPPSSSGSKLYYVTPFPKSKVLPKIDESNALSKTSHFKLGTFHSRIKSCKNDKVIASGMFRINPFKTSREENFVPNKPANVSVRTKPITVLQPSVIHKQFVNSNSNGLSSTGLDNTAKTRMPQPKSNTKNDRVLSVSKSSGMNNKEVEVQEYHRNLLLSKNKKHMSSECNNIKLAIRNNKSKVVCAMSMAFEQSSSKPGLQSMTSGQISSGLDLTYAPSTITTQKHTEWCLDLLFERTMYGDNFYWVVNVSCPPRTAPAAQAPQVLQTPTATTTTADSTPTPIIASSQATDLSNTSQDVDELENTTTCSASICYNG
ncbi:hypothetical protein Tco_0571358 [Tanacetum coccineum]